MSNLDAIEIAMLAAEIADLNQGDVSTAARRAQRRRNHRLHAATFIGWDGPGPIEAAILADIEDEEIAAEIAGRYAR